MVGPPGLLTTSFHRERSSCVSWLHELHAYKVATFEWLLHLGKAERWLEVRIWLNRLKIRLSRHQTLQARHSRGAVIRARTTAAILSVRTLDHLNSGKLVDSGRCRLVV